MNNETVVSALHVCKNYGDAENTTKVLKDISFDIQKGEFVSIMGPSGCGKSTLLYIIGGLEKATSGEVLTCGTNLATLKDKQQSEIRCQQIGFVFQFYNLVQNLTVEENILLPLVMAGKKASDVEVQKRLNDLLTLMHLQEKRKVIPSKLSGGQQQKVAIARAVISHPSLILADEPTGNLDTASGIEVLKLFQYINQKYHISILMVTHSEDAASYSSRVLRMKDGKFCVENKSK